MAAKELLDCPAAAAPLSVPWRCVRARDLSYYTGKTERTGRHGVREDSNSRIATRLRLGPWGERHTGGGPKADLELVCGSKLLCSENKTKQGIGQL